MTAPSDTQTQWTRLVKITRSDGEIIGVTDLDMDIVYDGTTYLSAAGYTPSSSRSTADLSPNTVDLDGLFLAAGLNKNDLMAGRYSGARVEVILYDWGGEAKLKTLMIGFWGETKLHEGRYVTDIRSLADCTRQKLLDLYSVTCRYDLGQAINSEGFGCGVDIGALKENGTVNTVPTARTFTASGLGAHADGYFIGGKIEWTSGDNDGHISEIKTFLSDVIEVWKAPFHSITIGDTFDIWPGCGKRYEEDCVTIYSNGDNFGGEPFVPGMDAILTVQNS